jgi:hypothetical protein
MVGHALLGEPHNCLKSKSSQLRTSSHGSLSDGVRRQLRLALLKDINARVAAAARCGPGPSASAPARKRFADPEIAR